MPTPGRASRGTNNHLPLVLLGPAFWVSAEAATDFTAAGVRGLLNSLAAVEATRAEVCSFVGFFEGMEGSLTVRGRRMGGVRSSSPRRRWVKQTTASDPDEIASAGTQSPCVRNGTGCMRAQRRSSIGGRPWPTPHESRGGFGLPAHRELLPFAVRQRLMCAGGLVAPCSPHRRLWSVGSTSEPFSLVLTDGDAPNSQGVR